MHLNEQDHAFAIHISEEVRKVAFEEVDDAPVGMIVSRGDGLAGWPADAQAVKTNAVARSRLIHRYMELFSTEDTSCRTDVIEAKRASISGMPHHLLTRIQTSILANTRMRITPSTPPANKPMETVGFTGVIRGRDQEIIVTSSAINPRKV